MHNSTPAKPALLLTPADAAQALAISPRKLWSMPHAGEIPHIKMGRSVRYPLTKLQAWIAAEAKGGAV